MQFYNIIIVMVSWYKIYEYMHMIIIMFGNKVH